MALVFEAKVGRNTPTLTVALTGPGHWPGSSKLPLHLSEARQRDKPRATLVDPSMPGAPRLSKDVRASQGAGRPGVHPCGTRSFPQGKGRNQGQVCCIQYDPHSVQYLVPTTTFRHRLKLWSIESLSWVAAPGKEKNDLSTKASTRILWQAPHFPLAQHRRTRTWASWANETHDAFPKAARRPMSGRHCTVES